MSTIKSSTTITTAYSVEADTTGALVIQTGATPTTAVTVAADQSVTFAQAANLPNTFGFKNRLINSDMRIDQRNAGAAVTTDSSFVVDRFQAFEDTDGAFSAQRDTTVPAGFVNSLKWTTTTADGSLSAGQYSGILQVIEGFNVGDFGWGTANAQTVTLSFWVRSSLTGTFGGSFRNSANNRSYPFTYAISVANTFEYKTVTVAGDTSGTWLTDNSAGLKVFFGLGVGSTFNGTAGSWAGANYLSATGAVSVIGTLNATWYITGVQLEKGSTATSFDYRPYGTELALCQRYYYQHAKNLSNYVAIGWSYDTTSIYAIVYFPVTMRAIPTALYSNSVGAYILYSNNTVNTFNTFTSASGTETSMTLANNSLSGKTAGTAGGLYAPSGLIAFSAEL